MARSDSSSLLFVEELEQVVQTAHVDLIVQIPVGVAVPDHGVGVGVVDLLHCFRLLVVH